MRSELWNTRIAELGQALTGVERASKGRKMRVLELAMWSPSQITTFVDTVDHELALEAHDELATFRDLVLSGGYERYYGDIPCRPLFLRMLIDDAFLMPGATDDRVCLTPAGAAFARNSM